MTEEQDDFELERGSGNVFADTGLPDAEREQLRAVLAAEIGKSLAADSLSVRDAERLTGLAAADFSRIRRAKLKGFTIDRLMTILDKLNRDVRVSVSVMPRKPITQGHITI
ncbi:helix-turn-helix domain-containing protein [Sphingobium ummariense]